MNKCLHGHHLFQLHTVKGDNWESSPRESCCNSSRICVSMWRFQSMDLGNRMDIESQRKSLNIMTNICKKNIGKYLRAVYSSNQYLGISWWIFACLPKSLNHGLTNMISFLNLQVLCQICGILRSTAAAQHPGQSVLETFGCVAAPDEECQKNTKKNTWNVRSLHCLLQRVDLEMYVFIQTWRVSVMFPILPVLQEVSGKGYSTFSDMFTMSRN